MSEIALTLLHPIRLTPIQSWEFSGSPVKIGRAPDNDVVLYSSVVSRYHLELWNREGQWELIGLGANGTYVEGRSIKKVPALHNTIVHLAPSGPKLLLGLGAIDPKTAGIKPISGDRNSRVQAVHPPLQELFATTRREFHQVRNAG